MDATHASSHPSIRIRLVVKGGENRDVQQTDSEHQIRLENDAPSMTDLSQKTPNTNTSHIIQSTPIPHHEHKVSMEMIEETSSNSNGNSNIVDMDQLTDEQMNRLQQLAQLHEKQTQLEQLRCTYHEQQQNLYIKQEQLAFINEQSSQLRKQQKVVLQLLQSIQSDMKQLNQLHEQLSMERDEINTVVNTLHDEQYVPLKQVVDQLRIQLGLPRLASLQEEQEANMAKYLEMRRIQSVTSNNTSSSSSSSRRRGRPTTSSPSSHTHTASSSSSSSSRKRRR